MAMIQRAEPLTLCRQLPHKMAAYKPAATRNQNHNVKEKQKKEINVVSKN